MVDSVLRVMPVRLAAAGVIGSPVTGSMKSSGERRTRVSEPSQLGELDDLGLLGGDRQDHDLLLAR